MASRTGEVRLRRAERVMGTVVSLDVAGPVTGPIATAVDDAVRWLHWVDATFSTYRDDSSIRRLASGEIAPGDCPAEVGEVLAACADIAERSGGYFSVTATGELDPSGYVKGWAVARAATMIARAGSASHSVNGAGDVQCVGERPGGGPWRIGIADPVRPGGLVQVVSGRDFAVATSGAAERGTHIVDPHTGEPPAGDGDGQLSVSQLSVTVTGPDLALADAYATAAFAMGYPRCRDWIAGLDGYAGFGVTAPGLSAPAATWQTAGWPGLPYDATTDNPG